MIKIPAIFQRYTDNILAGVTPTASVAPMASYSLATLANLDPATRVRWDVKTVTITFTISSAQGDILCIPMHNLDPGASVLTLTNGAGFSQPITIPSLQTNGFPPTLVIDLTILAGTRTSTVWHLVIASNSVNVTLGGCIAIYGPKRSVASQVVGDNFAWDWHERETHNLTEATNEYGVAYVQDYGTVNRQIDVILGPCASGLETIRNWWRANHGRARPSLFWPDPTLTDGYFGRWAAQFDVRQLIDGYRPVRLLFDELSKGQAL